MKSKVQGPKSKVQIPKPRGQGSSIETGGREAGRGSQNGWRSRARQLALIALGSNMGNRCQQVREAMRRLRRFSHHPLLRSSLWESAPVDCPPGSPAFVNAAVGLVPKRNESPESLLGKLQKLEKEFGRKPKQVLNEPRPLDLDLIAFGAEIRRTPTLSLPHPRAHQRAFVLLPLREIAPDFVLPGQSLTVARLAEGLPPDPDVHRLAPGLERETRSFRLGARV